MKAIFVVNLRVHVGAQPQIRPLLKSVNVELLSMQANNKAFLLPLNSFPCSQVQYSLFVCVCVFPSKCPDVVFRRLGRYSFATHIAQQKEECLKCYASRYTHYGSRNYAMDIPPAYLL